MVAKLMWLELLGFCDRTGLANDEVAMQFNRLAGCVRIGQVVQQTGHGLLANLASRLTDCRERWCNVTGERDIVKTDDRDILWYAVAPILQRTDDTNGRLIVEAKESCGQRVTDTKPLNCGSSAQAGAIAINLPNGYLFIRLAECVAVPFQAPLGQNTALGT